MPRPRGVRRVRPVLTGVSERPDGRLALQYSIRPGQRVTIVAGPEQLTDDLAAEIASAVIPLIERGNTEGATP